MILILLLRLWSFDYVDLFGVYELITLNCHSLFFLFIFGQTLSRLCSLQDLILNEFSILIAVANDFNTLHVFVLVGSRVLAKPLVVQTRVKASFALAQSLAIGLEWPTLLAVLTGVHALLISYKSTVHVSLILGWFMHAVLGDGTYAQSTDLTVSAVIEFTLFIQKVVWHFDAFACHSL